MANYSLFITIKSEILFKILALMLQFLLKYAIMDVIMVKIGSEASNAGGGSET